METISTYCFSSLIHLEHLLRRCNECCKGDCKSYHCPLCPAYKFKPAKLVKVRSHLKVHWKTRVAAPNGIFALLCHIPHEDAKPGHFHCPLCGKIVVRKKNIQDHVLKHGFNSTQRHGLEKSVSIQQVSNDGGTIGEHRDVEFGSNANHNTESEPMDHEYARSCEDQLPESGCSLSKRKCNKCGKWIGKVWFKRHMTLHDVSASKDINRQRHHATYIIDHAKGIFCSRKGLRGGGFIHIKKALSGPDCGTFCERRDCIQSYEVAKRGRHMSYECPHVQSIQYAKPGIEQDLAPRSLQALITGKLITQVREHEALELQEEAKQQNTPFLVYMPLDGSAQRYIYLSVYSGQTRYWSRLKRTVVTIDTKGRCIYCQCSPEKMTCKHKIIGKWYLNQEHPEVLSSRIEERVGDDATDETDYTHEDYLYLSQKEYPPNGHVLERMTKYIMMCKKYPDDASRHALYNDFESRATIVPKETHCHFCHAQLSEATLITNTAKIVFSEKIIKSVRVYIKHCMKCKVPYRYQEWDDRIHNYNDSLFLGFDVCMRFRSGLKNHVAIGRSVAILEDALNEDLNYHQTEQAYLLFESLTNHDYNFNCVLCGWYPMTLIWDGVRKPCFRFPVSDLPPPQTRIQETVDIVKFWSDIDTTFIIRGVTKGLQPSTELTPSYEYWGPWIGKESRHGNVLYNTEFRKRPQVEENEYGEPVPEELLKNLLQDEKVSVIRRLCRQMGIRPEGSAMDMILRMREKSVSKGQFDLAYEKVFGTSGGWVLGACPHGIVYAIKSLLRSESPRDYVDLLRSFKYRPNITIADIAHLIASHGNKMQRNFFHPNEGRLATPHDKNIALSKYKEPIFEISLQHNLGSEDQDINPTSGSNEHYALFDWFHEGNTKDEVESLRNISLLKGFSGIIDSQILEQRFSSLKRDLYFLNQMLPTTHMFVFRLLIHLYNQHCNKSVMEKQLKAFGGSCSLNEHGQLSFQYQYSLSTNIPYHNRYSDVLLTNEKVDDQFQTPTEPLHLPVNEDIPKSDHGKQDSLDSLLTQTNNINRDARDSRLERLQDDFRDILNSFHDLSSADIENIKHNIKYAHDVLFRSAELNRRRQLVSQNIDGLVIQCQGATNYCGLCCINNALGPMDDDVFPVTIEEMDLVADLLWIGMAQNPALGLISPLEALRDKEGFYSVEVIEAVLERHSIQCIRIHASVIQCLSPDEFVSNIQSEYSSAIFIMHPADSEHWLTLKYNEAEFILIDSNEPFLTYMTLSDAVDLIGRNSKDNGAVLLLRNTSGQSKLSGAGETHTEVLKIHDEANDIYALRTRTSKRRPSSWIFPPLAPKKRRYCICNIPDDGSQNIRHVRHHAFCHDWLGELNKLRRKYGFGHDILQDEELEMELQLWLKDQYLNVVKDNRDLFSFWYTLKPLEGRKSRLTGLFCKDSINCAVYYAEYVLYKETVVFLLMALNNLSYEQANSICLQSEINRERKK